MYGVPANLDLAFLHGSQLTQLCLGSFQIQLHFSPIGSISIEGSWELTDATGQLLDRASSDETSHPPQQLHHLLGHRVTGSQVAAPHWFSLEFDGGETLRIFDDSTEFESFSIQPGDIFV